MMTNAQLATASLDDIVFDGRNRTYGAYQLRALYQRHVTRALVIATAVFALLLVFPLAAQWLKDKMPVAPRVIDEGNILMAPPLAPEVLTPPPPPAATPPSAPPQQPTIKDIVPVVVDDKKAPAESDVPNQDDLRDTPPGVRTIEGDPNAGNTDNLEDLRPGTDETVTRDVVAPTVYTYVEQMPQLPGGGGNAAIVAAIQKATKYPSLALRNQVEGRIFVSFTVNTLGEVSDVKVVKGLGSGLDEETIRAVKTLPKFIPGKQNGREVSVSFTVPITFKIQ
ncbi:energy transducer TonB [Hymenobacter ruricola]|uniref:Energy transducer TonB n=1 Tax=Hymenobacter ruricola TaxID=2791023 RepID=A0ABS0I7Q7_9BACT|nr:energy transducer TonB [Hymenobacter ruricola]MBF9222554.1 energy transducer TonB [Hymenobacter ruricola]